MTTKDFILRRFNIHTDVIEIPHADRTDLAQLVHDLDFKKGVEVGVAAGEYSEVLAKLNPQMELSGVDPYLSYRGYKDYVRKGTFNALMEDAHARLDKYPQYKFIREMSLDAARQFEPESLDFVYIDANHSEPYVSQDIETWSTKVRSGGIVSGHDYAHLKAKDGQDSSNWAVVEAITKYANDYDVQLFIWGLEAKIPGLKREPIRSWMFIRP